MNSLKKIIRAKHCENEELRNNIKQLTCFYKQDLNDFIFDMFPRTTKLQRHQSYNHTPCGVRGIDVKEEIRIGRKSLGIKGLVRFKRV